MSFRSTASGHLPSAVVQVKTSRHCHNEAHSCSMTQPNTGAIRCLLFMVSLPVKAVNSSLQCKTFYEDTHKDGGFFSATENATTRSMSKKRKFKDCDDDFQDQDGTTSPPPPQLELPTTIDETQDELLKAKERVKELEDHIQFLESEEKKATLKDSNSNNEDEEANNRFGCLLRGQTLSLVSEFLDPKNIGVSAKVCKQWHKGIEIIIRMHNKFGKGLPRICRILSL